MTHSWEWLTVTRVAPILVFLLGITIVAELADAAGVFEAAARLAARGGRGSVRGLWLLVVLLGTVTTVLLSLDTTAVLLTPVVLALAARLRVAPWPFALATVWLANTASLLLPVSNLTNLLLVNKLHWSVARYTARMWLPALVAVVVSVLVLAVLLRSSLRGRYAPTDEAVERDPYLFRLAVGICALVGPLFVAGVPPWVVGSAGALLLAAAFGWRRREALRWSLLPWRLVLITLALFLVVGFFQQHGLTRVLGDLAGSSDTFGGLLRTAASGAVGSNLVNNLPAYVALEPVAAASPDRLLALLIGTNLGPLVTVWASLATLLWRERCRARGLDIRPAGFALAGLVGVPMLLLSAVATLWFTR